eukprot:TRINITY_DN12186_c0_g3_i1.p1 TRINITY_DN12186_c0_g3~~TRINITY_DN12186_c0_g3_i1.p1  ORF type:complete len:295 (-),score=53.97 TRINITY_DN12186_c0_g3_i1:701-1540(-)
MSQHRAEVIDAHVSPDFSIDVPDLQSSLTLVQNLVCDVAAAGLASFAVSPFVAILDRAIIENANGARPLKQGLKQLSRDFISQPHKFIRRSEFLLTFALYGATYMAANIGDSLSQYHGVESPIPKLAVTAAVNVSLCVAKDRIFTRLFAVVRPHAMPIPSYVLFTVRDSLTVVSSFWLPFIAAAYLQEHFGVDEQAAKMGSQFGSPAVMQFLSAPLHLLALDLYNRPKVSLGDRASFIRKEYLPTALARTARIGPAFGIGGVGNAYFRSSFQAQVGDSR